jgi:hypothetical protein
MSAKPKPHNSDGWRPLDVSIAPRLAKERALSALAQVGFRNGKSRSTAIGAALVAKLRKRHRRGKAPSIGTTRRAAGAEAPGYDAYIDARNRAAGTGAN